MPASRDSAHKSMRKRQDYHFFAVRWLARYGYIVDRPTAAVVIPETADGRVWLIRIRRVPTGTSSWELPGGEVAKGETPVAAGLRELAEECGLAARSARLVATTFQAAPGMGLMPHRVIIAKHVTPMGDKPVPELKEGIQRVRAFRPSELRALIAKGQINVFATLSALAATGWLR